MNNDTYQALGAAVFSWWSSNIDANTGVAKKTRSQLRRSSRPSEVLAVEATHDLHARIKKLDLNTNYNSDHYPMRLALVASFIAGIDTHVKSSIAEGLGRSSGDKRALSELRFQRILSASDDWELANRLRRSLPIVKRKTNVSIAGTDLFFWSERTRNRWCFQYFGSTLPDDLNTDEIQEETEAF